MNRQVYIECFYFRVEARIICSSTLDSMYVWQHVAHRKLLHYHGRLRNFITFGSLKCCNHSVAKQWAKTKMPRTMHFDAFNDFHRVFNKIDTSWDVSQLRARTGCNSDLGFRWLSSLLILGFLWKHLICYCARRRGNLGQHASSIDVAAPDTCCIEAVCWA